MSVRPKMGYVRAKIGLTGQFDRRQAGNYLQPCELLLLWKLWKATKGIAFCVVIVAERIQYYFLF